MSSKRDLQQDQKPEISLFGGDDGFCIRTLLAREPSLNQSYDLFYRESEGIPFKWETQPGTPRKCPQQDGLTSTPPLNPSPLMQSLKLRPPDHDGIEGSKLKSSKVKSFKKMVQKSNALNRDEVQKESLRFGELMGSVKDSCLSSSSFSSSWKDRGSDSSRDSMFGSGSCCRKGNIAGIQQQLIKQDGGEKHGDPAWTKKAPSWIKGSKGRRKTRKFDKEIIFSCSENMEINDSVEEFEDPLRGNMSKSSSSSASIRNFEALKMKWANYFSCGSWKGMKRGSCVFSKLN